MSEAARRKRQLRLQSRFHMRDQAWRGRARDRLLLLGVHEAVRARRSRIHMWDQAWQVRARDRLLLIGAPEAVRARQLKDERGSRTSE